MDNITKLRKEIEELKHMVKTGQPQNTVSVLRIAKFTLAVLEELNEKIAQKK